METAAHMCLKRLSIGWLRSQGYLAAAIEVRSPIAQWVLDVAGWRDSWWDAATEQRIKLDCPQTIIIECKQSRSDFLRDSRRHDLLLALRERYKGIRRSIEEHRIKTLEPQLRRGESSLFADMDEWDFAASRLPAYRRTIEKLERIDARVHGQTKFFRIARYALADALYIAAPKGMIARGELPSGWGLIECDPLSLTASAVSGTLPPSDACDAALRVVVEVESADRRASKPHHRLRLLRNIAVAASARAMRSE